jgi:hypothetical protein
VEPCRIKHEQNIIYNVREIIDLLTYPCIVALPGNMTVRIIFHLPYPGIIAPEPKEYV